MSGMEPEPQEITILDRVLILRRAAGDARPLPQRLEGLAAAHAQGIRRVAVIGDAGAREEMRADLRRFNGLLAARGLETMALRQMDADGARGRALLQRLAADAEARRRRRQLGLAEIGADGALAALQAIGADRDGALFAAVPRIDPVACTGCDACVTLCPSSVLIQVKDSDAPARYCSTPAACDACGLCREVCPVNAVTIDIMAPAPADIPLTSWVCDGCGVPVHMPAAAGAAGGLCPICRKSAHHKKLFQVLP